MIPHRVVLKNFLCHADREFSFRERPVWLLHGANGLGKSAVFDAMVFALFGESKRGEGRKNVKEDLIRLGETSLRVEFEFGLNGREYQVWRTRSRSGGGKQGVAEKVGDEWIPVRNVSSVDDLKSWVGDTLQLDLTTFTSSVLLRQGAAERLIDADGKERRELCSSFVDMEPFLSIERRMRDRRFGLSGSIKTLESQLASAPAISDGRLNELRDMEQACQDDLERLSNSKGQASAWLADSRNWARLDKARGELQERIAAAEERASRAQSIHAAMERLRDLRNLVVQMKKFQSLWAAQEDTAKHVSREAERQQKAQRELSESNGKLVALATERDTYRLADNDSAFAIKDAENRLARMHEQLERSEKAASLRLRRDELMARVFTPGLETEREATQSAVEESRHAREVLPHLKSLFESRVGFHQSKLEATRARDEADRWRAEVLRLEQAVGSAGDVEAESDTRCRELERIVDRRKSDHETITRRQKKFEAATEAPTCSECGQVIDVDHANRERVRMAKQAADAAADLEVARRELQAASTGHRSAQVARTAVDIDLRQAERMRDGAVSAEQVSLRRADEHRERYEGTLQSLSGEETANVGPIDSASFPLAEDVSRFVELGARLNDLNRRLESLTDELKQRESTEGDLKAVLELLAMTGDSVDPQALREEIQELALRQSDIASQRQSLADSLKRLSEQESLLTQSVEQSLQLIQRVASELGRLREAQRTTDSSLAEISILLPASLREFPRSEFSSELLKHSDELDRLEAGGTEAEHQRLRDEQTLMEEWQRQLDETSFQIGQIPSQARRPSGDIQKELDQLEQELEQRQHERDAARGEVLSTENQLRLRTDRKTQLQAESVSRDLHDRLIDLLGRDGLQRDLVRDLESQIIERANATLGRLSAGELQLEAPDPEGDTVFDLSVRLAGCPEPISVANLSGGQRFRVAIALALAICEGSSDGPRRLESIIIDEGFGSLDRDGRAAMVQELRDGSALAKMFKRIILVSHQDDFADAFPDGYRFTASAGGTLVTRFPSDHPVG